VPLPAGRRRLRAVNHDRGIAMEFDVVIQDKQVTRTRQGLD